MRLAPFLALLALSLSACNCGGNDKLRPRCLEAVCGDEEQPAANSGRPDSGTALVVDSGASDAGPPDAGVVEVDAGWVDDSRWCSADRWCREGQADDGGWVTWRNLNAVFARGQSEAYAVGDYGTLLRWDGKKWGKAATWGPADDLFTVHATGPTDVWVGGIIGDPAATQGMYAHHDGTQFDWIWKPLVQRPQGMIAFGRNDLFTVGYGGEIRHFNGSWWAPTWGVTTESINDVAEVDGVLWGVGGSGTLVRSDKAGSWRTVWSPTTNELKSIVSFGDTAIAAGGTDLLDFDGTTWTSRSIAGLDIVSVWGASPQRVWAVGPGGKAWRIEGSVVTPLETGVTVDLRDVHGVDEQHVWAVGTNGVILRLR